MGYLINRPNEIITYKRHITTGLDLMGSLPISLGIPLLPDPNVTRFFSIINIAVGFFSRTVNFLFPAQSHPIIINSLNNTIVFFSNELLDNWQNTSFNSYPVDSGVTSNTHNYSGDTFTGYAPSATQFQQPDLYLTTINGQDSVGGVGQFYIWVSGFYSTL